MTIAHAPASFPQGSDDDLLTIAEVAEVLRQSIYTVRAWRQEGRGPQFIKLGRRLVCTLGELRRWLEEQKQQDHSARR